MDHPVTRPEIPAVQSMGTRSRATRQASPPARASSSNLVSFPPPVLSSTGAGQQQYGGPFSNSNGGPPQQLQTSKVFSISVPGSSSFPGQQADRKGPRQQLQGRKQTRPVAGEQLLPVRGIRSICRRVLAQPRCSRFRWHLQQLIRTQVGRRCSGISGRGGPGRDNKQAPVGQGSRSSGSREAGPSSSRHRLAQAGSGLLRAPVY